MLKIEKYVTPSPEQWEIIIEGMRNPMNSWDKIDSYKTHIEDSETLNESDFEFVLGENDADLMERLAAGGSVHAKYRRMISVWVTMTAPLYFWKEFDTYKIGTVESSCSTMHKIHAKEFTLEDFSCEYLSSDGILIDNEFCGYTDAATDCLIDTIQLLNAYREKYLETKDKNDWWQIIQLLPSSYNQKRTVMLNYEVLSEMYKWRKDHKLDEWKILCHWIEGLPYFDIIVDPMKIHGIDLSIANKKASEE